jgi:hypothetical protein
MSPKANVSDPRESRSLVAQRGRLEFDDDTPATRQEQALSHEAIRR